MGIHVSARNLSRYVIPVLGVVLSLPTLLGCIIFWILVCYEVLIGDMKGTMLLSVLNLLRPPLFAPFLLYIIFGPLFTCVLCTVQFTRMRQESTLAGASDSRIYHITRTVIFLAMVAICTLVLTGGIARIVRGPT